MIRIMTLKLWEPLLGSYELCLGKLPSFEVSVSLLSGIWSQLTSTTWAKLRGGANASVLDGRPDFRNFQFMGKILRFNVLMFRYHNIARQRLASFHHLSHLCYQRRPSMARETRLITFIVLALKVRSSV